MDHLSDLFDELHQVGVELKDFEKGLLDFPAVHEGREICLCWHRGEQCVGAWHELDAGPEERHSLLEGTIAGTLEDGQPGNNDDLDDEISF